MANRNIAPAEFAKGVYSIAKQGADSLPAKKGKAYWQVIADAFARMNGFPG